MNIRFWQNSISSWKIAYSGFIDCRFPFERWGGDSRFPANARGTTFSGNAVSPKQPERVAHCLARAMCRFTTRRFVSLF
jgi:hypothetical protein